MNEIVKYHNDLNRVKIPLLSEQEHNLFMFILTLIRNSIEEESDLKDKITLYFEDLKHFSNKNLTHREIDEIVNTFYNKIFKADFTMLVKKGDLTGRITAYIFENFTIWHRDLNNDESNTEQCEAFEKIEIKVSPYFFYLVNELNANFTRFELSEFLEIRGQYTKTLYRLLKQFRNTGKVITFSNRWNEFCEIMGIPKDYLPHHIDQRVLKPAIKELSSKKDNPIFKNLTYKKIKNFKQKGKVVGIEFYFTPTKSKNDQDTFKVTPQPRKPSVREIIQFETEAEKAEYLRNKYTRNGAVTR